MRPLAPLLALLLLLAPGAALAHEGARCPADTPFPTLAVGNLPPGRTLGLWIPANQFGSLVALVPIDLALVDAATCAPMHDCHAHGFVGPMLCAPPHGGILTIHNPNPVNAAFLAAVGICIDPALCGRA